jgi:hypothetical protein
MHSFRSSIPAGLLLCFGIVASAVARCADIIVSAQDGTFVRVDGRATFPKAQGVVFSQDGKPILLQMDVERAIGVFAVADGKLVDTGERLQLAAGPVSIRSMPR